MSVKKKVTILSLQKRKELGEKIAAVTAYDATMAALVDAADVDILMVGDSLGMVVQGSETTLSVSLEEMAYHCRAVQSTSRRAHVVCDLPFLSYQVSPEQAVESAGFLLKRGKAESVKLEGGRDVAESITKIVRAGIPVMGHLGLTPQSVFRLGGFRVQGKTAQAAAALIRDARALEEAGVYSIVLEGVPSDVAAAITRAVAVPTIGIGAGKETDGQVLVCYDFLGMYEQVTPKFVKRFADVGSVVRDATSAYVQEVRAGMFPSEEHTFSMDPGERVPRDGQEDES